MQAQSDKINVLVTGAYGLIGNLIYARLAAQPEAYNSFGMVRRMQPSSRARALNLCAIPAGKLKRARTRSANNTVIQAAASVSSQPCRLDP